MSTADDMAWTPVPLSNGETSGFGLGWYISELQGRTVLHHGGSSFGFRSYVYWRPDAASFAGVFLNSEGTEPQAQALALLMKVDSERKALN